MPQATEAEFDAILRGTAFAPLGAPGYEAFARGFLRITGSDAARWLNGMVTNSIQALQPGEGNYNFLLNAQGRIQADCTIYRDGPSFLIEADGGQIAVIEQLLDKFIIMDDVELARVFEERHTLELIGPHAPQVLRSLNLALPSPLHFAHSVYERHEQQRPVLITASRVESVPLFHLACSVDAVEGASGFELMRDGVQSAGGQPVSPEALEAFRVLSGTPRYGRDIRNSDTARDLPQETNQTHALHFSKGCYLGQEIVERIRSRGQVHRLFTPFRLQGDLPTTFPAPLQVDGKPAGELTSAALVPLPQGPQLLALGYARREFLETKKQFTYPQGTALPRSASKPWSEDPLDPLDPL